MRGEKPTPKEIIVSAGGEVEIKLLPTSPSSGIFMLGRIVDTAGKRYRILITPKSTGEETQATIPLQIETSIDGPPKVHQIFLYVR
jgi:hypothetical protein